MTIMTYIYIATSRKGSQGIVKIIIGDKKLRSIPTILIQIYNVNVVCILYAHDIINFVKMS